MSWRVELYVSLSGQKPVADFIASLQPVSKAKLLRQFSLLEDYGIGLGMPSAKPIGDGLFELRVRGKEEVRALYVFLIDNRVVILHGFKKKTMAILQRDLRIAIERKKDIERREKHNESKSS